MPTSEELDELIQYSKRERTSLNGVNGMKIISKINGNSIFFPYGGSREGTEFSKSRTISYSGWLASKSLDVIDAAKVININWSAFYWGNGHRYHGFNVRPVMK